MSSSFRVLASVGILILAAAGCQQGKPGAVPDGGLKKAEARTTTKAGKTSTKSGSTAARSTTKTPVKHEESKTAESHSGSRVSTLTYEDNGREVELRQGQVITVMLDANRASGLSWVLVESPQAVMVREGSPTFSVKAGKRGTSGTETWRFRGARPGHQTVKLEYRRKWAQSMPERTFRFEAVVR